MLNALNVCIFVLTLHTADFVLLNAEASLVYNKQKHDGMKKIFLTAAVMLASVASYAQHAVGSITLQPKVGVNIADLTKLDGSDVRVGLAAGAEFEYQATDMLGISFGALYSMQGCKSDGDENGTLKLDYINIPILANVYVAKGFAVKLGIQPGFKVSSKMSAKAGGVSASANMDGVKSFDFSIPVGLSYEFNNFVIDGRYNFGLTKWADDIKVAGESLGGVDSKHSVFQITLGYKFDL